MAGKGRSGAPRQRAASAETLQILRALESKFGELIDDLDMLGLSLAAARAEHALDTFRQEAERLASR